MSWNSSKKLGEFLLNRHNVIENFLSLIGCKEDILLQAELIEHTITPDTVNNIKILNIFFEKNKDVLEKYVSYRKCINRK